jgi:hypothetical protein
MSWMGIMPRSTRELKIPTINSNSHLTSMAHDTLILSTRA